MIGLKSSGQQSKVFNRVSAKHSFIPPLRILYKCFENEISNSATQDDYLKKYVERMALTHEYSINEQPHSSINKAVFQDLYIILEKMNGACTSGTHRFVKQTCVVPCHLWDPDLHEGLGIPEVQPLPAYDGKGTEQSSNSFMLVLFKGKTRATSSAARSDLTDGK